MELKRKAQDDIIAAIVNVAFNHEDNGYIELAEIVRDYGTSLAKKWGINSIAGLPKTWPLKNENKDYGNGL